MEITLEGSIVDVEEFSLLSDTSKVIAYLTSKIGPKVRATVIQQEASKLMVIEKIE